MPNNTELIIEGLMCDNCPYENVDVKYEDYPNWVNEPCPECGESLLTEEDFNTTKILVELAENVKNFVSVSEEISNEKVEVQLELNGTGILSVKDIKMKGGN